MTDQGWFLIPDSASIYTQQRKTLLSNTKRISDTNVLNMPPIAESTWVPTSVVSLRKAVMLEGSQPEPDSTMVKQVTTQSLLTLAVEQKVYREEEIIFRDQQDFALNCKGSENDPQEHDDKEIDRQIQADQYVVMETRQETEKDLIRYGSGQKLVEGEKDRLEKSIKKLGIKLGQKNKEH